MSIVNVKGTLELANCIDCDMEAIKKIIADSGIDATVEEDVIFFDNTFDNSQDFAESFAAFVARKLPIGHEQMTLVVTGEQRYDIILKGNKVYIQLYELVPGEIEEYKG